MGCLSQQGGFYYPTLGRISQAGHFQENRFFFSNFQKGGIRDIYLYTHVSSLGGILWSTDYRWLLGDLRSKWLMTLLYLLNGVTFPTFFGGDGMGKCL